MVKLPYDHRQWLDVPGGPYTAAAIASIALNEPVAAVDGNVNRVISRWACVTLLSIAAGANKRFKTRHSLNQSHPGDHNQAMMELVRRFVLPKTQAVRSVQLRRLPLEPPRVHLEHLTFETTQEEAYRMAPSMECGDMAALGRRRVSG